MGHPELLVFGIDPDRARITLNELGERVHDGEALLPGLLIELDRWTRRVIPEEVPNPGDIVFMANAFYRRPAEFSVPVLQLTYDDINGLFPWDVGCAEPELQPRPGTFHA
jgi:hypothetical protein